MTMEEKLSKADKKAYGSMDKKYRAESDVHYLLQAREIKSDPERMKMAMHCAKKKSMDAKKESKQLKNISKEEHNDD